MLARAPRLRQVILGLTPEFDVWVEPKTTFAQEQRNVASCGRSSRYPSSDKHLSKRKRDATNISSVTTVASRYSDGSPLCLGLVHRYRFKFLSCEKRTAYIGKLSSSAARSAPSTGRRLPDDVIGYSVSVSNPLVVLDCDGLSCNQNPV
jgi:hypothetical protein